MYTAQVHSCQLAYFRFVLCIGNVITGVATSPAVHATRDTAESSHIASSFKSCLLDPAVTTLLARPALGMFEVCGRTGLQTLGGRNFGRQKIRINYLVNLNDFDV